MGCLPLRGGKGKDEREGGDGRKGEDGGGERRDGVRFFF